MKVAKLQFNKLIVLFLVTCMISVTSCDSGSTSNMDQEEENKISELVQTSAPSQEASKQFFYAWLADCANDQYKEDGARKSKTELLSYATMQIDSAIRNDTIKALIGNQTLGWGPVVEVGTEGIGVPDDYFVLNNLIYCLKSASGDHYSIGIAGTDMISPFDWLHEDLIISTVPDTTLGHGNISKGADLGWSILRRLEDHQQGKSLIAYLHDELRANPDATVSVAGHSLGGALTQVFSGYLKRGLPETTTVEAWVFAGPTAGDATYADALTTTLGADNYHGYINSLDMVPHLWEPDSLAKMCSLYEEKSFCHWPIGENPIITALQAYLQGISGPGHYKIPGTPHSFVVPATEESLTTCSEFYAAILVAYNEKLNSSFSTLANICGARTTKEYEELSLQAMLFLAEMGKQHTTSYTSYFFDDQPNGFAKAVARYTSGPKFAIGSTSENALEGLDILNTFLQNAGNYLLSNPPQNCNCN